MLADSEEIVALAALEPVEVQVDPPSREYSYPVIAEPPSLGAVQVSVAELDDAEPANDDGVPGSVTATAVAVEDAAPVPVLFVAVPTKEAGMETWPEDPGGAPRRYIERGALGFNKREIQRQLGFLPMLPRRKDHARWGEILAYCWMIENICHRFKDCYNTPKARTLLPICFYCG